MSLRVWLPLDGDLHNQGCSDASITNTSATVNTTGKIGSCYSFGTSKSYLKFDNMNFIHNFTECSVSLWLKILSWNTSYATYFQFGLGSTPWAHYIFGLLRNGTASTLCFTISNGSSATNANCLTPALDLNIWYHLTFTYSDGHCKIYVNGAETKDYNTTIVPNFAGITTGSIGACNNGSNYQTNCLINDFRIYDHCLSAAEVKEIAQGLVLHYKLDASSEEKITIIPSTNVYSYPTFNISTASGGWNHWGPSGHSGSYGQNTDKKYIYNKNNTYSHWITEDAGTGKYYLLYQSPAFEGGYRSLQAIIKEENGLPITESICYPDWNARNGGVPNYKWTTIKSLGDGFYYCCCEGVSQDGSNDLIGINVQPGYKIYVSECYVENNTEACSPIFTYSSNIVQDSSGYNHNGTLNTNTTLSNVTARYSNAVYFGAYNTPSVTLNEPATLLPALSNCTITWWGKYDTNKTLLLTGQSTSHYIGASNNNNYYHGNAGSPIMYKDGVSGTYKCAADGWHFFALTGVNISTWTTLKINGYSSGWPLNGYISDFRIYCTPLLDTDIKQLYNVSMKVDKEQNIHTFELYNKSTNLLRSELIIPTAKASYTSGIGEITMHNNTYAYNIAPAPFYKNISNSESGILKGQFAANTSYILDMWIDVDSVIYNGNNVAGGLTVRYTDGTSDTKFVLTGGNKGYQHKILITPNNKTIDRLDIYYYTSTDVFYRTDSYIGIYTTEKIKKTGILDTGNLSEMDSIAQFVKGGHIHTKQIIER